MRWLNCKVMAALFQPVWFVPGYRELKYQPEGSKMAVELTRSDVDTLEAGEFLNDKIVDFYLK